MSRIKIAGIGNVLLGDDSAGPYAVRRLESEYDSDADVQVEDLGTPGLESYRSPDVRGRFTPSTHSSSHRFTVSLLVMQVQLELQVNWRRFSVVSTKAA